LGLVLGKLHSQVNNFHFSLHSEHKESIPVVKKPMISYMSFLELEPPKFGSNSGLGSLLSDIVKAYSSSDVKESKSENTYETTTKSETKVKTIEKTKTKTETKPERVHHYDYYDYTPYKSHQKSAIKKVLNVIGEVIIYPISVLKDLKYNLDDFVWQYKQSRIEKMREATICKENERLQLEYNFENMLNKYKSMFEPQDILPDMSEFDNYHGLSKESIKQLSNILCTRIEHQKNIIDLKARYCRGSRGYSSDDDDDRLKRSELHQIKPDYNINSRNYKKELKRLCMLYLQNAKIIEEPINSFNNVSKNFFQKAKKNLEEIAAAKKHWLHKTEMIPYLGIIPKSIRVADQFNLTRCILSDFEDITENYVKNGIHPIMKKFVKQYDDIVQFTKHRKLTERDKQYTKKLLNVIENAKTKRVKTYSVLYSNFVKGGLAIQNTCKNIRLKDGISCVLKTAKLLAALG